MGPGARYGLYHAFLWTETDRMIDISPDGWTDTFATNINESGWIIGYGVNPEGKEHSFLLVPEPATLALLALGGLAVIGGTRGRASRGSRRFTSAGPAT